MGNKKCSKCGVEKPATTEYFGRLKDGFQSWCKECKKKDHAKHREQRNKKATERYYELNPKEILPEGMGRCSVCNELKPIECFGKSSKNKNGHRGQCKQCRHKEYTDNADVIKENQKYYYEKNKAKILWSCKDYREKHKDKIRGTHKRYYENNKERIKERVKNSHYERMKRDPAYKRLVRYRTRLYKALKGYEKPAVTRNLIGCDIEVLMKHLENQFEEGMSWDNYGEWHVDHIKPCAVFDFNIEKEVKECFHYTNLQPLWAEDNFRKHAKLETPRQGVFGLKGGG